MVELERPDGRMRRLLGRTRVGGLPKSVAPLALLGCLLAGLPSAVQGQESAEVASGAATDTITLVDFRGDREWYVVNDGVMGGRSRSSIEQTAEGTGVFAGRVSLENNGGFASVRTRVEGIDVPAADGVTIRVNGDGQQYQLRFRTDDRFDGVAYRANFQTSGGGWEELTVPFSAFVPSFRGRVVEDAEPLDPSAVRQLTLMIADKQEGDFRLEVEWVKAFAKSAESEE